MGHQVLVWWTIGGRDLSEKHRRQIDAAEPGGVGASVFSVWEVAMLVSKKRLAMSHSPHDWLNRLPSIPTLHLLPATPQILIDSTQLPGTFHGDPADRIIVATARAHDLTLLTTDEKILVYEHVKSSGP